MDHCPLCNAIIAEVRRQVRTDAPRSYSFRQKIINILWDFKKGHRTERLRQPHPCLLETFSEIIELEALVYSFRNLFNEKHISALDNWTRKYQNSAFPYIQSFISGLNQDLQAVRLSVQENWSNGGTKGLVNRLKTFKRLMYGRVSFPVLKNRVLYQF